MAGVDRLGGVCHRRSGPGSVGLRRRGLRSRHQPLAQPAPRPDRPGSRRHGTDRRGRVRTVCMRFVFSATQRRQHRYRPDLTPGGTTLVSGAWSLVDDRTDRNLYHPLWTGKEILFPASASHSGQRGPVPHGLSGWRLDPATGVFQAIPPGPVDDLFGDSVWTGAVLLTYNTSTADGHSRRRRDRTGPSGRLGSGHQWVDRTAQWPVHRRNSGRRLDRQRIDRMGATGPIRLESPDHRGVQLRPLSSGPHWSPQVRHRSANRRSLTIAD